MFKFLHAADLHLDSPLRGLERYDGAPAAEIRSATRRALENLVSLACGESVDFVLIAGDLYDGDRDDYQTVLYFSRQMVRLQQAGIPVFAITGNHDAASRMTKSLRLPDNVRILSHQQVESVECPELGVFIHGRGFAKAAETGNLAREYPLAKPGRFNIGLLHSSLTGAEGHEPYAPCSLDDLRSRHYDYWALGHVHERAVVERNPWIVYPGNIQGRHIRETGPRGCMLVTVQDGRHAAERIRVEFRALDVFRWQVCTAAVDGCQSPDEVVNRAAEALAGTLPLAESRPVAVRLIVSGATAAHPALLSDVERWSAEIRAAAQRVAAEGLWIEKIRFQTQPLGAHPAMRDDGPLAEIREYLAELRGDPALRELLAGELTDLQRRLPPDASAPGEQGAASPEALAALFDEVEQMLMARLLAPEHPA